MSKNEEKELNTDWMVVVLTLFAIPVFLGLVIEGGGAFHRQWQASSWSSTVGVVESWRVDHTRDGRTDYYTPFVSYVYQVDELTLRGYAVRLSDDDAKDNDSFGSEQSALNFLSTYRIGEEVQVYFNPDNPYDAVLERNKALGLLDVVGLLTCLFLLLFWMFLHWFMLDYSSPVKAFWLAASFALFPFFFTPYEGNAEDCPAAMESVAMAIRNEKARWLGMKPGEKIDVKSLGPPTTDVEKNDLRALTYERRPEWEKPARLVLSRAGREWKVSSFEPPYTTPHTSTRP